MRRLRLDAVPEAQRDAAICKWLLDVCAEVISGKQDIRRAVSTIDYHLRILAPRRRPSQRPTVKSDPRVAFVRSPTPRRAARRRSKV